MIRLDFANMGDPAPQKPQLIGGRSARAEELRNTQDATQACPVAPLQDLSKPAAPAPPNGAGVSQTAKKAQPVRVTRTKEGTDVKIHYDQIPGLPDDQKEAFKELDKDGSGCVSLNEMLLLAESHTSLQQQVIYLTGAVLTVMVGIFLVSLAAAVLAQTTAATGNALTAPGGSFILNTGTMSQTLPMKYASFLDKAALGRIHTIVINGTALFLPPTTTGGQKRPCGPTCPGVVILKVGMSRKYNDTLVEFFGAGAVPTVLAVNRGQVTVTNLPGAPAKLLACGQLKCNSLTVGGIDIKAIQLKAKRMGLARRDGFVDTCMCLASATDNRVASQILAGCLQD